MLLRLMGLTFTNIYFFDPPVEMSRLQMQFSAIILPLVQTVCARIRMTASDMV